ncbi:hypothetical protein ACQUWY_23330, partial [Ralstonia pseudosolanacearum]
MHPIRLTILPLLLAASLAHAADKAPAAPAVPAAPVTAPYSKPNPAWLTFVRTGKARAAIRH